jgi:PAS domain S-box-containing protein
MTNSSTSPERLTRARLLDRVAELEAELARLRNGVRDGPWAPEGDPDGAVFTGGGEQQDTASVRARLERGTLEAILDSTEDFLYLIDLTGRFTYVNRALLDLWGIELSEAVGKTFHELGYPSELAGLHQRQIEQVIASGRPIRASNAYENTDGETGEYEYIFAPVLDGDARVEAVAGVTREVSEIRKTQAERERLLRETAEARAAAEAAERRLRNIFDQAPALVAVTEGPDHRFVLANPWMEQIVGRGRLAGRTVPEVLPELEAQGVFRIVNRVFVTGERYSATETRLDWPREPGRPYEAWYNWVCQPLFGEEGEVTGMLHHAVDVTEQVLAHKAVERANATLHDTEVKLSFALAVADLGVWELDLTTEDAWRDQRHDEIFGYAEARPDWGLGALLRHVVPEHRDRVSAEMAGSVREGKPWDFTCQIIRADGERRWIAARGEAVLDARGDPARLIGIVRDITDEREAEAELRAAKEAAEAANQSKSEFLAIMSHELRTPLNAISGYADLLQMGIHGPVTEAQQRALGRIQYSQQHLLGLINEVLNFAKLESGSVHFDIGDVSMNDLLSEVEGLVEPPVKAKGLSLEIPECEPDLLARADAEKLRQIVVNLVSNAIKFTEARGHISLSCEIEADEVRVCVEDTGIGIPPDKLETIFDPFVQVRADLTRTADGTGLGLAISRELARGMGGDLLVESELGRGSTFTVCLPVGSSPTARD